MKITSIKYNSKENVFNLIIDDNEKYNLSYDLYESYKLFEEMTIDDDLYLIIKKYHIFYNAKKQTLKYATYNLENYVAQAIMDTGSIDGLCTGLKTEINGRKRKIGYFLCVAQKPVI